MNKYLKIIISIIVVVLLSVVIDFICIFTINRPLFAIKYIVSDTTGNVYKGLFYDTYNCMEYSVPQVKFKGTKFNCAYIDFVVKESDYVSSNIDNVSTNIYDISLSGATIVIKDTNKKPYVYGSWYKIEKEVDGKWYEVPTIIEDYGFDEMAYLVDKNNEVKFVMNWEWLYGKLPSGSYRILKQVNDKYIAIPFNIATTSNKIIEVIKPDVTNLNKFNKYLERDNKVIYLAGNIEEVYFNQNSRMTLKDYISKSYQSIDDGIKHLTDNMELIDSYDDGGTKLYRSKEYDITIIKCNTLLGSRDIYIGDYSMNYNNDMCR